MIHTFSTSTGTLTFSRRPDEHLLKELARQDLDAWWNVARELADYVPRMALVAREVLWADISDFAAPNDELVFRSQVDRLVAILRGGGRVHVSCYAGRGRTGLALACLRIDLEGDSATAALAAAKQATGGPESEIQRAFVRHFGRGRGQ